MGSSKSGTYKPKDVMKAQCESITTYASEGKSRRSISIMLQLSNNVFLRDEKAESAFQDGLALLRDQVSKTVIASKDYRDRAKLFDRLCVLAEPIDMPDIKSIEDLQKAMSNILKAFASGSINSEQLNSFTKSAAQLSQLYFDQSVQAQLDELKAELATKADVEEEYR